MADTPHLDLPFRFVSGAAAVVEQDSLDDVSNCVEATLRTLVGQRLELPGFGIDDPTFQNQPIDTAAIVDKLLNEEPRASVLLSQAPDRFNSLVARVTAQVSAQEVNANV